MSESQEPGNDRNARSRSAGDAGDPGHARAREISEARNAAKARASARKPDADKVADPDTDAQPGADAQPDTDRLRRRARFLRERDEAKELRDRVQPRRSRSARMRQELWMRTFRR